MRSCVPNLLTWVVLSALLGWAPTAQAQRLIDPTRPPDFIASTPLHPTTTFELTAILISRHRRLAVINGVALDVGATLAGATVLAIRPDAVRLRLPSGRLVRLTLYPTHMRTALRSPR
ncbi:MAG: MSHA biogenesis protein MshK [Gammaproteobacteria bacterium]